MEDIQASIDRVKTRLDKLEAETQDVISRLLARQSRIAAVGKSLTNLSSQRLVLRSSLARLLEKKCSNHLPEFFLGRSLKTSRKQHPGRNGGQDMLKFHVTRPSQSVRPFAPSYFDKQIFAGNKSCADPCGKLRGWLYELWLRPLRFSVTFGWLR
jgi:hypothetical protein